MAFERSMASMLCVLRLCYFNRCAASTAFASKNHCIMPDYVLARGLLQGQCVEAAISQL